MSNDGGASLAAAERDRDRLIDGVVVSEPQVQPRFNPSLTIKRGNNVIANHGKGLYDYITFANLYQPCAALAPSNAGAPGAIFIVTARAANRCAALHANGLLSSTTPTDQATEAQAILNANGWEPESNILGPSHYGFQVAPAVSVTYANAHGRLRVLHNVCGFSMGGTGDTGCTGVGPMRARSSAPTGLTGSPSCTVAGAVGFSGWGCMIGRAVTAGPAASVEADSADDALPAPGGAWMAAACGASSGPGRSGQVLW